MQTVFICKECSHRTDKWFSQCPNCKAWNTVTEKEAAVADTSQRWIIPSTDKKPIPLIKINHIKTERMLTDIPEFDRVLGGGIVPGSLILIGGDPGIGKSTLLLQTAFNVSKKANTLYVSGEENESQILMRANRLGCVSDNIYILSESNIKKVVKYVDIIKPVLIIIDSIQTAYCDNNPAAMGSIAQVKEVTSQLLHLAKNKNIAVIIIGHITKDGAIAGPKVLEHIVDTVLYFEEDNSKNLYRILRSNKNRFGRANEIGIFEMSSNGLESVENPSGLFHKYYNNGSTGSVVSINMEGTRPMFIEIQSLITKTSYENGSRIVSGLSPKRVSLLVSLLENITGENLGNKDIFVNVLGGIKAEEPTCDLPTICSLMSSYIKKSIDNKTIIIGEVGLAGEIRNVHQIDTRLQEAYRMGFTRAVIPVSSKSYNNGMEVIKAKNIENVFKYFSFL